MVTLMRVVRILVQVYPIAKRVVCFVIRWYPVAKQEVTAVKEVIKDSKESV